MTYIDINNSDHSYFLGFFAGDGSLYRRKDRPEQYKATISIKESDVELLYKFQSLFPEISHIHCRAKPTNFSADYRAADWTVNNRDFCRELISLGLSPGSKFSSVEEIEGVSPTDFFRGLLDADGSLGFTKQEIPFVSLCTGSEAMKDNYIQILKAITGFSKTSSRNKRDGAFNIMVLNEDARDVCLELYTNNCLSLNRKSKLASDISKWERSCDRPKAKSRNIPWTLEEDEIALRPKKQDAIEGLPNRSTIAIQVRRARLRQARGIHIHRRKEESQ